MFVTLNLSISESMPCSDTPGWLNGQDLDCNAYERQWCHEGHANTGSEWTLGAKYNYPEDNCCVCGKNSIYKSLYF